MDIICTICWEALESGRILATTCGHIYHEKCIMNWTMRSYCCPDCRNEPSFPLRVIHFTSQDELDTQEMHSLDSTVQEPGLSESDLLRKSKSAGDISSGCGYSSMMEELQTSPDNSRKSMEIGSDQRYNDDGCRVCKRFRCLQERAIKLRNLITKYEESSQTESLNSSPSKKLKLASCSDPEAKPYKRQRFRKCGARMNQLQKTKLVTHKLRRLWWTKCVHKRKKQTPSKKRFEADHV